MHWQAAPHPLLGGMITLAEPCSALSEPWQFVRLFNAPSSSSDKATADHKRAVTGADIALCAYQNLPTAQKDIFPDLMYMRTLFLPSHAVITNTKLIKTPQIPWAQHFINEESPCGRLQPGRAQCLSGKEQRGTSKGAFVQAPEQSLIERRDC